MKAGTDGTDDTAREPSVDADGGVGLLLVIMLVLAVVAALSM